MWNVMNQWTPYAGTHGELSAELAGRVHSTRAKLESGSDPVLKEQRINPVRLQPSLRSLATIFLGYGHTLPTKDAGYKLPDTHDPIMASWVSLDFLMAGYTHHLSKQPDLALCVSPSHRSTDPFTGLPLSESLTAQLPDLPLVSDLSSLLLSLYPEIPTDIYDLSIPMLDIPFFHDLGDLVLSAVDEPLSYDACLKFSAKHPRPGQLQMKVKTYASRGDRRAYYVDSNPIRSLCGSIIGTMILGERMSDRKVLPMSRFVRAFDRNLLNDFVSLKDGHVASMSLSDISSFTNSNLNLWASHLMVALNGEYVRHGSDCVWRSFLVSWGPSYIEVDLRRVLRVYLYLTVMVEAETPYGAYVAPGGYLGVAGNINSALQAFALHCKWMEASSPCNVTTRLGGDDCSFAATGSDDDVLEWNATLRESLTNFVGLIKDMHQVFMSDMPTEWEQPLGEFCKKAVRAHRTSTSSDKDLIEWKSVPHYPVLSQLNWPNDTEMTKYENYRSLVFTIREMKARYPELPDEMLSFYSTLARSRGLVPDNPLVTDTVLTDPENSEEVGSVITDAAREVIVTHLPQETPSGIKFLTRDLEVAAWLTRCKVLMCDIVLLADGRHQQIYRLPHEPRHTKLRTPLLIPELPLNNPEILSVNLALDELFALSNWMNRN